MSKTFPFTFFAALASLGINMPQEVLPLKRCEDCIHNEPDVEGAHCYMFKDEPEGDHCGQFKEESCFICGGDKVLPILDENFKTIGEGSCPNCDGSRKR